MPKESTRPDQLDALVDGLLLALSARLVDVLVFNAFRGRIEGRLRWFQILWHHSAALAFGQDNADLARRMSRRPWRRWRFDLAHAVATLVFKRYGPLYAKLPGQHYVGRFTFIPANCDGRQITVDLWVSATLDRVLVAFPSGYVLNLPNDRCHPASHEAITRYEQATDRLPLVAA